LNKIWIKKIAFTSFQSMSWIKMNCMTRLIFFLDLKSRNHFVLISRDRLK